MSRASRSMMSVSLVTAHHRTARGPVLRCAPMAAAARKRPAPKPPKGRKSPRSGAAPAAPLSGVPADDTVAALRAEVAALAGVVARLSASADQMSATAAELPRAEHFQPLADHLYAFAQSAPRLVESLEAVRAAVAPLETAAQSLGDVSETLVATH